jgi:soluble lytic murein transglycosylase-like protein
MSSNIDRNMTPTADATNQPTASGAGDLVAGGLVGSDRVHGSVKGNKKRIPQRRRVPKLTGSCWYTIEIAAAKLDLDAQALRARCRRAAQSERNEIVARLGMGVIARKLGTSWRVYVPSPEEKADAV